MAIDKQRLLHLVQHFILKILGAFALEQLEAECVNCADEHLGHARDLTERLAGPGDDALLQFRGRLVCERERNDVARKKRFRLARCE